MSVLDAVVNIFAIAVFAGVLLFIIKRGNRERKERLELENRRHDTLMHHLDAIRLAVESLSADVDDEPIADIAGRLKAGRDRD